nr:AT-rich interactive domain-containing protein 4B-like [Anolis sagrei ordinatus]
MFTQAQITPESAEEQPYRFIAEDGDSNIKSEVYSQKRPCKQGTSPAAEPVPVTDYLRASEENIVTIGLERQVINSEEKEESLTLKDVLPSAPRKGITSTKLFDKDNEIPSKEKAEEKQTLDLTVETDASSEYPGVFCETKIHTPERLIEVKMTSKHDSSTIKVPDDRTKEVLKIGTVVEVKDLSETYQKVVINNLTDASLYTTTVFDEDKKTLKHSTLRLKEERHFAESKIVDQLFLTNPEHFDMSTSEKKVSRKKRSNHISEEESPLSLSKEERENRSQADGLTRQIIYTDYVGGDKRKRLQFPSLEVRPDYSGKIAIKKDSILVRSSKDSEFSSVPRKDVRGIPLQPDAAWRQAFVQASKFYKSRTVPDNWKTGIKEEREECGTVWGVLSCYNLRLGIRKRRVGIG